MEWFASLLPATVVAAIALFLVKEVVEGVRRWRANARKSHVFRTLLARECELNHWTYECLERALLAIQEDFEKKVPAEYSIKRDGSDFVFRREDMNSSIQWVLPDAHTDLMSKVMLDVATLDKSLFASLEAAYNSAVNMRHVREWLMRWFEKHKEENSYSVREVPQGVFFIHFAKYGLGELDEILADLDKLYRECTDEELKCKRVR